MQTNHNHLEKHFKHKCKNYRCYTKLCGKWARTQPSVEQTVECNYFSSFSLLGCDVPHSQFTCCTAAPLCIACSPSLVFRFVYSAGARAAHCLPAGAEVAELPAPWPQSPPGPLGAVGLSLVRLCPVLCAEEQQLGKAIQKRCFCNGVISLG